MPSDQIGGDNLISLNLCLLKLMITSLLSSMVETCSWSWGFFSAVCVLPQAASGWKWLPLYIHTCSGVALRHSADPHEARLMFSFCWESSGVPLLVSDLFCFISGALYQWETKRESKIIGIFFFLNEVTFSRTENLLHISYAVSVKSLWSGVMCGETFLPAGRNLSESISVWEVHI